MTRAGRSGLDAEINRTLAALDEIGPATLTVACRHRGMPYETVNRMRNALTRRGLVEHTGVRGVYAITDLGRARLALVRRGTAGARPAAS